MRLSQSADINNHICIFGHTHTYAFLLYVYLEVGLLGMLSVVDTDKLGIYSKST